MLNRQPRRRTDRWAVEHLKTLCCLGLPPTMAGYNAAFLTLAMVATAGLLLIVIAMPETTPSAKGSPS